MQNFLGSLTDPFEPLPDPYETPDPKIELMGGPETRLRGPERKKGLETGMPFPTQRDECTDECEFLPIFQKGPSSLGPLPFFFLEYAKQFQPVLINRLRRLAFRGFYAALPRLGPGI